MNKRPAGVYLRPESMFSYYHKDPDQLNHMNKLSRNILQVTLDRDSTYAETAVLERPDYFAKNQLFVIIKDSDEDRLSEFLLYDFEDIAELYNTHELKEYMRYYREDPNENVQEMARKNFGININLPDDSELKTSDNDFAWVKRDRSQTMIGNQANQTEGGTFWVQQGILFWTEKYDSAAEFTVENILKKRDTVLKYNVAGKVPGSYMATEYSEYYDPKSKKFDHKGYRAVEIRGLWKHEGNRAAFGGGPFVQYTIFNEAKKELVTVCGYVYGPGFDKREYIREIDAMLRSIEVL